MPAGRLLLVLLNCYIAGCDARPRELVGSDELSELVLANHRRASSFELLALSQRWRQRFSSLELLDCWYVPVGYTNCGLVECIEHERARVCFVEMMNY